MKEIVAIDLETTGLNPELDEITEIGVVVFNDSRVQTEWSSLVNPGRPVPSFISQLTGITDAMLADAPRFSTVKDQLEEIVGNRPVLGHNIGFDLAFLRQKGLFKYTEGLDTFPLATVLMPTAGRYGLSSLAHALNVPVGDAHRALDDARMTHMIFLRLRQMIADAPLELIEEIVRLGAETDWGAGWVFEDMLEQISDRDYSHLPVEPCFIPKFKQIEVDAQPLAPVEAPAPFDIEHIAANLEPGGPMAKQFPGYENRSQQVSMLYAVAEALSQSRHMLVEAGTGIGKSLAYMIPAAYWATQTGQRVLVSTNTINLQDQLIHKDIPALQQILDIEFKATVLKGRSNYICPRRLLAAQRLGPNSADEMRVLAKILVWLAEGGSGTRSEINLSGNSQRMLWNRLSAANDDCRPDMCPFHTRGQCAYFMARRAAESAHVLIVNHALLLADIATGNRVIPEYDYLIVDEAHHMEDATTDGLSFEISETDIQRLLKDLGNSNLGLFGQIRRIASANFPREHRDALMDLIQKSSTEARNCLKLTQDLFKDFNEFLKEQRDGHDLSSYGQQERIQPATRTLSTWTQVEIAWDNLRAPIVQVSQSLSRLEETLDDLTGMDAAADDLLVTVRRYSQDLQQVIDYLDELIFEPNVQMIYWLSIRNYPQQVRLHAAPLEAGPLIEQHIWHKKEAVIMTSATMTTAGEFDYMRKRLRADDADELMLGSPFDYENSTMLYLVNDIPEPNEGQHYQRALENGLIRMCRATQGRTLALFTSHKQLRATARKISEPLAAAGITVYTQSEGASRHNLLENFRASEKAVLLGTRSFWEGIDVPGSALSVVMIARLPFAHPGDPIVAARAETYEMPFNQYMVPEAILRFRQGFGRLIRTRADRGVVVSFDKRLLSKNYGRLFIDSLPAATIRIGSLADLPDACERWLGE